MPSVAQMKAAFKLNSTRWSALLDWPYWDPIRFTVIDSMHNHYLGLLQDHCRKIWGMNIDVTEEDDQPTPSAEDVAAALDIFYTGTAQQLSTCTRAVIKHLCNLLSVRYKKTSKAHMINRLLEHVSTYSRYACSTQLTPNPAYQGRPAASGARVKFTDGPI